MKKSLVAISIITLFIFLVGCLDYKAYDIPKENSSKKESSLIEEISKVEKEAKQINTTANKTTLTTPKTNSKTLSKKEEPQKVETKTEEKILPELSEKKTFVDTTADENVPTVTVKENQFVKLNINVTDPYNDPVSYSFSKPLSKTGDWKTNYGDAGEYMITITASDQKITTTKRVKLVVEKVNVPPTLEDYKDLTFNEGQVVKFEPKVKDPNNDPVTVQVSEPLKNGTFMTDYTSAGVYPITVIASDGEMESKKTFKLNINNVNVLPTIEKVKDLNIKEGDLVKIEPKVNDVDKEDKVKVTISDPVGDDGIWQTSYTDHGKYVITITADDGHGKTTKNINLVVEDVNMPPIIKLVAVEKN